MSGTTSSVKYTGSVTSVSIRAAKGFGSLGVLFKSLDNADEALQGFLAKGSAQLGSAS